MSRRRGPWRSLGTVEFATPEWVHWFNHRRLLEPIGDIPPAEYEARYSKHRHDPLDGRRAACRHAKSEVQNHHYMRLGLREANRHFSKVDAHSQQTTDVGRGGRRPGRPDRVRAGVDGFRAWRRMSNAADTGMRG